MKNLNEAPFIISTDSGCDLSLELCKEKGIIPLFMNYIDGENAIVDTMQQADIVKFYKRMEDEAKMFKTSAVNIQEAYDFLKSLLEYNKPVIQIYFYHGKTLQLILVLYVIQ